ncbi:hypothetical protein RUND412_010531 [Rhizina undulata]
MISQIAARSAFRASIRGALLSAKSSIFKASTIQIRLAASVAPEKLTPADENAILAKQRLNRPLSPHLTIYQPQLTWVMSGLNRITGGIAAAAIYGFFAAYAVSPLFGWHLDSATLAASFGSSPVAAKVGLKALYALPFTYHSWNGVRHLLWDTGRFLDLTGVYRTGYAVLALTAVSTVYLALI